MKKQMYFVFFLLLVSFAVIAQRPQYRFGVNVNTGFKNQVLLELNDSLQALLLTRVATPNTVFGANAYRGMIVFDSVQNKLAYYDGTAWLYPLTSTSSAQNIYNTSSSLTANRQVNLAGFGLAFTQGTDSLYLKGGKVGLSVNPISALHVKGAVRSDSLVLLKLQRVTTMATTDSMLIVDNVGIVKKFSVNSLMDTNIYNQDGALKGNRIVTMAANNLTFSSTTGNFIFNPTTTGKIGIGTTSPTELLDIQKSGTDNYIKVQAGGTNANSSGFWFTEHNNLFGWKLRFDAASDNFFIDNTTSAGATSSSPFTFTRDGNFGIGVASPISKLHVIGAMRSDSLVLTSLMNGATTDSLLTIKNGIVSKILPTAVSSQNIYNTSSSLTANRQVNLAGFGLAFTQGTDSLYLRGGKVGVSVNPISSLHVKGAVRSDSLVLLKLQRVTTMATTDSMLIVDNVGIVKKFSVSSLMDTNIYNQDGTLKGNRVVTMAANNLTFSSTTGNFIFNPTSTGKIGIGTASPTELLDIQKSGSDNYIRLRAGGTNTNSGGIWFTEHDNLFGWKLRFDALSDNLVIETTTTATVTSTPFTFTRDGSMGIGTTTPTQKLHVSGNTYTDTVVTKAIKLVDAAGNFNGYGMSGNWGITTVSDERLKENIKPYSGPSALKGINSINIVEYDWKASKVGDPNRHMPIGVIAQNVQKVFPDAVQFDKQSGNLTLRSMLFSFYLMKATQELSKQVDDLKNENQDLKQRIEKLEQGLNQLMNSKK